MSWTEWLMILFGLKLIVALVAALWSLERGKNRHATVCLVAVFVYLAFFIMAKNKAESEYELQHAIEHQAVQEQMESIREL